MNLGGNFRIGPKQQQGYKTIKKKYFAQSNFPNTIQQ